MTATRFDPDTVNVLYPDSSAQYWSASYAAVPGTRLRIDGVFPYARYTSWNLYDPALRPFAKLSDYQLQPDPGSANPYIPGRRATHRPRGATTRSTSRSARPTTQVRTRSTWTRPRIRPASSPCACTSPTPGATSPAAWAFRR